ncbi:MAG TPA: hypothetical protein VF268_16135 [Gammaproteobacteria bacterium]
MKADWDLLRLPLTTMISAVIVSIILLIVSVSYNYSQQTVVSTLENELAAAKLRYEDARRDKALYRQYVESYFEYSKKGVIGDEQRLNWIEEIQEINKRLKLPSLKYEISPQTVSDIPGLNLPDNISVRSSTMRLSAGLLHEGDALFILETLRKEAGGFYALQQCRMDSKLPESRLDYRPSASYVDMDCKLDWYTITVES